MEVDPIRRRLLHTAPVAVGLSLWTGRESPKAEDRSEGKSHTGREIRVGPARDIKSLRQAAALARVGSELALASSPALFTVLLLAAATAWLAGWLSWAARYAPVLVAARLDGRPG